MNKTLSTFIILVILFTNCKTQKPLTAHSKTNQAEVNKEISYTYSSDLIRIEGSDIRKGWANRNDIQVLNINIVNNSAKPIHGSQFNFISENKNLETIDNKRASQKLKTQRFPKYVYIVPIILVGVVVYLGIKTLLKDTGTDELLDDNISLPEKDKKEEYSKLNPIQKGLIVFNVAKQIVMTGEQISGLIAFKSKTPIEKLEIHIKAVDYEVVIK
jgi:hypothetical protein